MPGEDKEGSVRLRIIRGSVDSVSLFEITDYELEILEKGSPSSTLFNFSIFFLSIGISFVITLMSTEIASQRVFLVFLVIATLGIGAGIVLLVLWSKFNSSNTDVCKRIRARVPATDAEAPPAPITNGDGANSAI